MRWPAIVSEDAVQKVAATASRRWIGAMVIVVVGLLQLHLPHCLAETSTPSDYATFPAAVVVATMLGSAVAAITILRGLRAG